MTYNAHLAKEARLRAITGTPKAIPPLQVTPPLPTAASDTGLESVIDDVVDEMMFFCPDCGIDAWGFEEDGQIVHEDFYVSNELWDSVCPDDVVVRWVQDGCEFGMGRFVMCIGCFEKRLGRKLTRADLRSGPGLSVEANPPSKRFEDRWHASSSKHGRA